MLKIFSGTIIVILTVCIVIFIVGYRAGDTVEAELIVRLPYDKSYVYEIFTDIESYPERKRNLENIEILDREDNQIIKWKENYENGSWRKYELIGKSKNNTFDYKIYESSSDYTTEFTATFSQGDQFSEIKMTERGTIPSTFKRGIRKVLLDDYYLKSEAKWLRVSILEEHIRRN